MAAKTTYLANRVLDQVLNGNAQFSTSWAALVYVGLFLTDPGLGGSIASEVVPDTPTPDYARQVIAWGTIASGFIANTGTITFAVATVAWGDIYYAGIMDVATLLTGNMLYKGLLGAHRNVGIGDQVSFANGTLIATES